MKVQSYNSPVAETVAQIIKEKGIKKSVLAEQIGITNQQLCDMLNGRRIIKVCDIPKIAKALTVQPNDLYPYTIPSQVS